MNESGFDPNILKTYAGYFYDEEKLKKSSSGGIATALSEAFIINGGYVFGVRYSQDFRNAEYAVVDKLDELDILKGSKYITSRKQMMYKGEKVSVYNALQSFLEQGKKVLFIGLGCDIGAVYRFCERNQINTDNLYTVDLICHGPTDPEVAKQFLNDIEKKQNSKIVDFSVKYKKVGWKPQYMRVVFADGTVKEEVFYETDYGKAFAFYSHRSCYDCRFKGQNHMSDLTIGDYWGIDKESKEYNSNGVSVAFVNRPDKGERLLNSIDKKRFYLFKTDTGTALAGNRNYYTSRELPANYDKFTNDLQTKGLHYAVVHSEPIKKRIKKYLKKLLKSLG